MKNRKSAGLKGRGNWLSNLESVLVSELMETRKKLRAVEEHIIYIMSVCAKPKKKRPRLCAYLKFRVENTWPKEREGN